MDEIRYPYKPKPVKLAAGAAFFLVGGVVLFGRSLDGRALLVDGLIYLDPDQARVFFEITAIGSVVMALAGLAGVVMGLGRPRYLVFKSDRIEVPGYVLKPGQTIAYRDITDLQPEQIRSVRYLNIRHGKGKIAVMESMLPDAAAFDAVCQTLRDRAGPASRSSRNNGVGPFPVFGRSAPGPK